MNRFKAKEFTRQDMVTALRKSLANRLTEPYDPSQRMDVLVYNTLLRGKVAEICESVTSYSLEVMQSELLDPETYLDDKHIELIADFLKKDIYIINSTTKDVYVREEDEDIFYKNRGSIVLLALDNHFEVIGISKNNDPNDVVTYFSPDSPFISAIRERYRKIKNSNNL